MSSLSISEAIEQASSTLSNEGVKDTIPEVVETEAAEVVKEDEIKTPTPETTQVKETEKEEEGSFTDIDPKTLPPELKSVYDNLNKGYTQARQKEKAEFKKLKEELEQLKTKPKETPVEQELTSEEILNMTPEQFIEHMSNQAAKKAEMVANEAREKSFTESAQAEYNNLDDRLNIDNEVTYDPKMDKFISGELDRQLEKFAEEKGTIVGFDYKSAGKKLIEEWDQYMDTSFKKYIARQNQIAKSSAEKFAPKNPGNKPGSSKPAGSMSLKDAIFAARQSLTSN